MIEKIRATYITVLEETDLLDKETSQFAVEKIKAMETQVVYPDYIKNPEFLENITNPVRYQLVSLLGRYDYFTSLFPRYLLDMRLYIKLYNPSNVVTIKFGATRI